MGFISSDARARASGLAPLADRLVDGTLHPPDIVSVFAMAYHEALLRSMSQAEPGLARFNGELHQELVDSFRELDRG